LIAIMLRRYLYGKSKLAIQAIEIIYWPAEGRVRYPRHTAVSANPRDLLGA
jgi:hypothetical protein